MITRQIYERCPRNKSVHKLKFTSSVSVQCGQWPWDQRHVQSAQLYRTWKHVNGCSIVTRYASSHTHESRNTTRAALHRVTDSLGRHASPRVLPFAVPPPSLCGIHGSELVHDVRVCRSARGCWRRRGGGDWWQFTSKHRGGGSGGGSSGGGSSRARGCSFLVLLGMAANSIALAHSYELRGAGLQCVRSQETGLLLSPNNSARPLPSTSCLAFAPSESTLVHKYYSCQTRTHSLYTHHLIDGRLHHSVCARRVCEPSPTANSPPLSASNVKPRLPPRYHSPMGALLRH